MEGLVQRALLVAWTALGVELGAALAGGMGAALMGQPPLRTMLRLAQEIKIWAVVAAMGGTFTMIETLESGLFQGEIAALGRQLLIILAAFLGAQVAYWLVYLLAGGK